MKWLFLAVAVIMLVLFQTSISPAFDVFGVAPNLLLVMLCCLAVLRHPGEVLAAVALAGISTGLLAFQGMAESVAALAPIAFAAMWWSSVGRRPSWLAALLLIAGASLAHFAALAVAVEIETTGVNWVEAMRDLALPSVLTNVLLGLPVYVAVRAIAPAPRTRAAF